MPIRAAREVLTRAGASRAGQAIGLAALALVLASQSPRSAVAGGDTRTLSFHHLHTGEDLTVTYMRDGQYDPDALKQIDHELRDWRRNEEIHIDPRLIDAVWEVYHKVGATGPIQVVCGYRSPATNAMLRRRSRGVAQFSQHMLGRAMDFYLQGVNLETLREAGMRLQLGGVGYYPTSGSPFVHMDVGNVRHWPRMTRAQLARVFPDGRTVHVPSDGRPLAGYALALADIEQRKSSPPAATSLEAARNAGIEVPAPAKRNLFAALFRAKDEDEDNETAAQQPVNQPAPAAAPADEKAVAPAVAPVPLPVARPTARIAKLAAKTAPTFDLASAETRPVELTGPAARGGNTNASANDLVARRGLWQTLASVQPPAQVVAAIARPTPAPAPREPQPRDTTGAVAAPWPVKVADAADHVPAELALAYAAQAKAEPRVPVTRGLVPAGAVPHGTATLTQARVAAVARPTPPVTAPAPALKPGTPIEDPWLRALVIAPNLQEFMTSLLLGQPDMRDLQPLMVKPDSVVTMTFGDDPNSGMVTDHFGGSAVVFVNTTTFAKRTAALQ